MVGKILDRGAELRAMAQDVTKNTGDIENYSKEFIELQSQLQQIKNETFNGISLFGAGQTAATTTDPTLTLDVGNTDVLENHQAVAAGAGRQFAKWGRTLYTHPGGQMNDGSISLNVANLEYVLEVGQLDNRYDSTWDTGADGNVASGINLGNVTGSATDNTAETNGNTAGGLTAAGFVSSILGVSMGQLTNAIEKLADVRAENGAEQNRIMQVTDLLRTNMTNLEAAHGRIMDADIALESTRFARYNVLVQAGAAMTAQANQLTNVALALLA